ncbi:FkbM family methyltransferase [Lysobacter arenosi]|uniref:FkbM family methyltransferase n=1 Tax=Lysobacter arenosi TaxID=2795387 RepID=A0ABX7RAJ2_9GAMM|nr:FkbM family methyltransferase [Lysobacter arenosi]QSX75158.1 FkbM family methyltransferase [Lysobacter arenosi]
MEQAARIDIGGRGYTLVSDDDYLAAHGGVFEPDTVKLFRHLASGSNVALDIGANVGCTALLLSQIAKQVHAFEPSPSTHHWLHQNTRQAPNVTTHNLGLGRAAAVSELTFAPNNRSGGFVSDQTKATEGHTVETIQINRLDDVVRAQQIGPVDFIKMDVEGYELEVIKGAPETLWRYRPVIALEMNHWCLNAFHRVSVPDFLDYLTNAFPYVYAVHQGRRMDVREPGHRYDVMRLHILGGQYNGLVCAYDAPRLNSFLAAYQPGLA